VVAVGDPAEWISDRVDEFRQHGSPNLSEESSRFTINAGSERYDLWRVAIEDGLEQPILGEGGGGYQYSYLRERTEVSQEVRDAHGVPFEVFAELGFPGLILLIAALGGALAAIVRARRAGPAAAALTAIALASGTYWLVHASIDWFWAYPGITAPVMALLGAAAAPGADTLRRPRPRTVRVAVAATLGALALTMVSPFLAQRYVDTAFETWRTDLDGAYEELDRARALNPFTDLPSLAEGAIAREAGDADRAVDAFGDAIEERPEEWAGYYVIALLLAESDPQRARAHAATALELNPQGANVRALARRFGLEPPPRP